MEAGFSLKLGQEGMAGGLPSNLSPSPSLADSVEKRRRLRFQKGGDVLEQIAHRLSGSCVAQAMRAFLKQATNRSVEALCRALPFRIAARETGLLRLLSPAVVRG